MSASPNPLVALIVGSVSDAEPVAACRRALDELGIGYESRVLSAHRTPRELAAYVDGLEARGLRVVVAAAGAAAHLAGVVAAHTRLPVVGVPLAVAPLHGFDALLSMAQMPGGVPVATMSVGSAGAKNAAYFAARILALGDERIRVRLAAVVEAERSRVLEASLPEMQEKDGLK